MFVKKRVYTQASFTREEFKFPLTFAVLTEGCTRVCCSSKSGTSIV